MNFDTSGDMFHELTLSLIMTEFGYKPKKIKRELRHRRKRIRDIKNRWLS